MTDDLDKLEKILGGKIERKADRAIPGLADVDGQEVIYFSGDGHNPRRTQLRRLIRQVKPPLLKGGGTSERGCTISLPDGTQFHAVAYHGDIEGWRKQIAQGAQELGLLTARISEDKFAISDGREIDLSDCRVAFD